jgi:hypothetical protein
MYRIFSKLQQIMYTITKSLRKRLYYSNILTYMGAYSIGVSFMDLDSL